MLLIWILLQFVSASVPDCLTTKEESKKQNIFTCIPKVPRKQKGSKKLEWVLGDTHAARISSEIPKLIEKNKEETMRLEDFLEPRNKPKVYGEEKPKEKDKWILVDDGEYLIDPVLGYLSGIASYLQSVGSVSLSAESIKAVKQRFPFLKLAHLNAIRPGRVAYVAPLFVCIPRGSRILKQNHAPALYAFRHTILITRYIKPGATVTTGDPLGVLLLMMDRLSKKLQSNQMERLKMNTIKEEEETTSSSDTLCINSSIPTVDSSSLGSSSSSTTSSIIASSSRSFYSSSSSLSSFDSISYSSSSNTSYLKPFNSISYSSSSSSSLSTSSIYSSSSASHTTILYSPTVKTPRPTDFTFLFQLTGTKDPRRPGLSLLSLKKSKKSKEKLKENIHKKEKNDHKIKEKSKKEKSKKEQEKLDELCLALGLRTMSIKDADHDNLIASSSFSSLKRIQKIGDCEELLGIVKHYHDNYKPKRELADDEFFDDGYLTELLTEHPDIEHEYQFANQKGQVIRVCKPFEIVDPSVELVSVEAFVGGTNRNYGADGYVLGRVFVGLGQGVEGTDRLYEWFCIAGNAQKDFGIPNYNEK